VEGEMNKRRGEEGERDEKEGRERTTKGEG
jgi:hypothetical protein